MSTEDRLPIFNAGDVGRMRKLFAILAFSLIIPGLVKYCFFNGEEAKIAEKISRISSYFLLVGISLKYAELSRADLMKMMNFRIDSGLILVLGLGVGLFGFVLGENALEIWVISNFNKELGYSLWPFQQIEHVQIYDFSLYFFLMSTIIAPLVEEFFFRGLLFPALAQSRSWKSSACITSAVFTFCHPMNLHIVGTMVFSLILCWIYYSFKSLWMCTLVHGVFNFVAINVENYGASWLARTLNQVSVLSSWSEQFVLMEVSIIVITLIVLRVKYKIGRE